MEAGKVGLKALGASLVAILLVEAVLVVLLGAFPTRPMVLVGMARVLEVLALLGIACQFGKGAGMLGLHASRLCHGLKRGLIWSAGFGCIAGIAFAVLIAIGADPLGYLSGPMPGDAGGLVLLLLVGGLLSPIAEEIFFRGLVYGYVRRAGIGVAVTVSTLLFALAHAGGTQAPVTQLIGGIVFALAYEFEDNLMAPITIHVLGNTAIYSIGLLVQSAS